LLKQIFALLLAVHRVTQCHFMSLWLLLWIRLVAVNHRLAREQS